MEYLWTPWRSTYIKAQKHGGDCVFCDAAASDRDKDNLIVYRGRHCFIILNRYPYTSGHLMIAPYAHVSKLTDTSEEVLIEMARLARRSEDVLTQAYSPDGINLGMNLGKAAGAGIAEHIHLHMLPRWSGDANFMTSVANTRIIPELLDETYFKVRQAFGEQSQ